MPRTTIQPDGRISYRTSLFPVQAKAQSFARCLTANDTRFEHVMIHASERSKWPKWFVTFEPKAEARKDAIHSAQQDNRAQRAAEGEFIFWPDGDKVSVYWCFSVASGETYEVTLFDCTCADYEFRCRRAGIQCKHMLAWSAQRAAGLIGKTDKVSASVPRVAMRPDLDF